MVRTEGTASHLLHHFYLTHIAPRESREMVDAHSVIHNGSIDTLCFVTAAAVAWVITGVDCAPPFSDVWHKNASMGTGPPDSDRVIAYGDSDSEFDETHTLVALARGGKTLVIDSCWSEARGLTVQVLDAVPEPLDGQCARFILLP
jgi:hypothetical protein